MQEYILVVYSNPVEGKEEEYNDWYNNQHLSDVLAQPDYIQARRYKLTDLKLDEAMPNPHHQYVAFYHLLTNDPDAALKGMVARVEAGTIGLSDAMAPDFLAYCYQAASPLMESV